MGQTRHKSGHLKDKVEKCEPQLTCCLRPEHNEPPHKHHSQKLAEAMYPVHSVTKVKVIHINTHYIKAIISLFQNVWDSRIFFFILGNSLILLNVAGVIEIQLYYLSCHGTHY